MENDELNAIFKYLGSGFIDDSESKEISDALTRAIADKFKELHLALDNYEANFLDPATCFPEWLDAIARWSAWSDVWDIRWSIPVKRKLLSNSDFIWSNRGNRRCIKFLFEAFELQAVLMPTTGFILDSSIFPDELDYDPFSYRIVVPATYAPNSEEYLLIQKLINEFLPCWISLNISYS